MEPSGEVWLASLLVIGMIVVLTVVPVMLAAKWAGARRSGFLHAFAAVVLATIAGQIGFGLIGDATVGLAFAVVLGLAVYAFVLGTSFVSAIGIAVVAVLIQWGIVFSLVWLGVETPFNAGIAI
jgi:hypothetical protein